MVYLIRMTGSDYYKIGYTSGDVAIRCAALQTGAPRLLEVVAVIPNGTEQDETRLHAQWIQYRTDGGEEWFAIPADRQADLARGFYERDDCHPSPVIGSSAFDVRPVRGGQQHDPAQHGENVPDIGAGFGSARRQSFLTSIGGKH